MRRQLVQTVERLMERDERVVLILGDIGVFGFRKAFEKYPSRVFNIGILEQAMIGFAAGLAKEGMIPIVHTIAPFLVERAFEQLKIDFGYQALGGNFISVGASYDYAELGCTHHCPADVPILRNIPNIQIVVPGAPAEFNTLFCKTYGDAHPTYYRLTERPNETPQPVDFGKAIVIKKGSAGTVIAVGPSLTPVLDATVDLDVSILYYTTIVPFDAETLRSNNPTGRIVIVEPYYSGSLCEEVCQAVGLRELIVESVGVPHRFLTNYGRPTTIDEEIGLTPDEIRQRIQQVTNA
jgi:transketolase